MTVLFMCVMQIIDDVRSLKLNAAGEPLEAALTRDLHHLGMMRTITYAYSDATAAPPGGAKKGCSGGSVCWMLLEHCDKGSVVVSFNTTHLGCCVMCVPSFAAVRIVLLVSCDAARMVLVVGSNQLSVYQSSYCHMQSLQLKGL